MAQGRGGAVAAAFLAVLCLLLVRSELAEAATYVVGDSGGWSLNTASWANGKRFRAGDVLVFRYNPSVHNVAAVTAAGYSGCSATRGSRALTSGNDRVTLSRGTNYFICTFAGHCQSGMKMAITAM